MMQIAENVVFRHSEFGIRAGFPRAFCAFIQIRKRGIKASDITSNRILAGSRMLDGFPAITLLDISGQIRQILQVTITHDKEYDSRPIEVLEMATPIQSISVFSLDQSILSC